VVIGKQVLQTVHTSLHKFRVTFKLLLGALGDFRPECIVPYEQLQQVDRIALKHLSDMVVSTQKACDNFEFYKAVAVMNRWANLEFSAFYMEAIKDRLYTLGENSTSRRAAQTTLYYIYHHLQEVLGPITPLLVEETWDHTPEALRSQSEHPLRRIAATPTTEWQDPALDTSYHEVVAVHSVIKNLQEQARGKKQLGSSLQSFVHLVLPSTSVTSSTVFHQYLSELPDLFVVSSVTLADPSDALPAEIAQAEWQYEDDCELPDGQKGRVYVYAPQASKCSRCWRYAIPEPVATDEICDRCDSVVSELEAAASPVV
jgi:isoleucyl-tRNA synthetase